MNAFQTCQNTLDAIPLYLPQQLYLKPIARLNISLQLPQKKMGKSISNWEVMEQLRFIIKPDVFTILKVTNTNLEFIRFEAEVEHRNKLEKIVDKLDRKTIKLKEFPELLKLRASHSKSHFPTRHEWDTFFRDAKNMNEMKPGERPDTIHISNLPIKWFVPYHLSEEEDLKPSEKIFYRVFEKFGQIRCVDIPICDPYRNKMKAEVSGLQTFDFNEEHYFEGYVQFKDYIGFTKAMDALRGMKLLHKEADDDAFTVNIIIDFDKTKHLCEASIRRREIVRDRLVRKDISKEEKIREEQEEEEKTKEAERQKKLDEKCAKEQRRREREEKRKAKILAKLKVNDADEINEKIAKEEKKLLKAQRRLEAIRLVEVLFQRIKNKHEKRKSAYVSKGDEDEITKLKNVSELQVNQQKEKLNRVVEGRGVLKSILSQRPRPYNDDSSSSDSSTSKNLKRKEKRKMPLENAVIDPMLAVYGYHPVANNLYPYQVPPMYSNTGMPSTSHYFPSMPRGRGMIPGPSRGMYTRRGRGRYRGNFRGKYPPELQQQYYKYFEKFLHEHDDRPRRSFTRSRSRSRSRSYSRSKSRSRRRYRSNSQTRSSHKSKSRRKQRSSSRNSSSSYLSEDSRYTPPAKTRSRDRSRSDRASSEMRK